MDVGAAVAIIDACARELTLFACMGFMLGGIDDLLVDLIYFFRRRPRTLASLPPTPPARFAIVVPAWDEAAVIGAMLGRVLERLDHPDFRIYVGCYPNDQPTLAVIADLAQRDSRVRLVVNAAAGPTTKGDNLNSMWRALKRDEAVEDWQADAVVLHDAEDVIHPAELTTFERLLADHAVVQLPVMPLIAADSRWVSAHYADEFAQVQPRELLVRQRLGAGLPLAGVGCALRRDAMDGLAAARGDAPFDASSLVEDYELGLTIAAAGGRGVFARVVDELGQPVCVRAFFPGTLIGAARQKARWMAGIALLGWDRLGWGARFRPFEYWMRMRDRRAPLAAAVLAGAYLAMLTGMLATGLAVATGTTLGSPPPSLVLLLTINSALLVWRMAMRGWATGRAYGWREGLRALPRTVVANFVALLAARRAFLLYAGMLRGQAMRWDKTAHTFPTAI